MRVRFGSQAVLAILLMLQIHVCLATESADPNNSSKYLDAVREFADNVLKYGRDTYGPKHTPLFVDGLNIHTHEPVKWIDPDGDRWILCNLTSQQNLFRVLDGLTRITGDPKYKQAAMEAIKYAFENLRSPNGLLYWGGHSAYDVQADRPCGRGIHEFKGFYPYYELMWEVDPNATKKFIEAFWSAHIMDWSNLDMNRHSQMEKPLPTPWKQEYKGGPVFFKSTNGTSISASRDLIYAAAWLTKLSAAKEPLVWGKRLAHRYVETRHPNTGISYWCFSISPGGVSGNGSSDDVIRTLVPGTGDFPWNELTNRIARECCIGYFMPTPEISVQRQLCLWQSHLLVGAMLGSTGKEFKQWALEELTAFGKASYREKDNVFVPILTDGTNLEGYVVKEDGPLGPKGVALEPVPAGPSDLWAYAMGYRVTEDEFMWEMAQCIAKGNEFGDIGATPKDRPQLMISTNCSNPYALLAFMELHTCTGNNGFLEMAKRVGYNILARRFHKGFFVASNKHIYTKFDAVDSLALLRLHSVLLRGIPPMPEVWPSTPFFENLYRHKDQIPDNQLIYTLTESAEPPLSLQEAAAVGKLNLVKTLIDKGVDVDGREDSFYKTALHHAAINGHRHVAEFLLAKGAQVDAWNLFPGGTPLDYAVEKGHKEVAELLIIGGADVNTARANYPAGDRPLHTAVRANHKDIVELLIEKGADVNAKNNNGQTPLDVAVSRDRSEVVKLLIAKGADISFVDISFHAAARFGYLAIVENIIEKGTDVNAKDTRNRTALHYAAREGHKDIVELLIANGTNVNAKGNRGRTPLFYAFRYGRKDTIKVLVTKGADVNFVSEGDYPPLHYAVWDDDVESAKLLVNHGAKFDTKDQDGFTAFRYAAEQGNRELVEFFVSKDADVSTFHGAACVGDLDRVKSFVEQGADVDAKDEFNWTPLFWAVSTGQTDVAEFLISRGADVQAKTSDDGSTAIHQAAQIRAWKLAELLISKGADVNSKNNNGSTPLIIASFSGNRDAVEWLIAKGAEVNVRGREDWTPLHRATRAGERDVVGILLSKGADVNAKDSQGRTPLWWAEERNHTDIVELLLKHGAKE